MASAIELLMSSSESQFIMQVTGSGPVITGADAPHPVESQESSLWLVHALAFCQGNEMAFRSLSASCPTDCGRTALSSYKGDAVFNVDITSCETGKSACR